MLQCYACKHTFEGDSGVKCPGCGGHETIPMPEPPSSVVAIRFAAPGSTVFHLEAVAEAVARRLESGAPQIAVPGLTPAGVRRFLRGIRDD